MIFRYSKFKSKATLAEVDELLEFIDLKLYPSKECIKEANELKNMIECETIRYNNVCSKQMENSNVSKTRKFLKLNGLVVVPCDKANVFTLMPVKSYNDRMQLILDGKEFKK